MFNCILDLKYDPESISLNHYHAEIKWMHVAASKHTVPLKSKVTAKSLFLRYAICVA